MESSFARTGARERTVSQVRYDFAGKVALVTGAARGQGRSHALGFASAGADVVLVDCPEPLSSVPYAMASKDDLERTAAECEALGVKVHAAVADVRDSAAVKAAVQGAIAALGKIDIAVCNAGIASIYEVVDMPEEAWDELIDINLKGVFLAAKYVAPQMMERRSGSIIMTGSVHSFTGVPGSAHYVASKHGVAGLAKSLAIELAPFGVRVNYVCPTAVNTSMVDAMLGPTVPADHGERLVGVTGSWNQLEEGAPPLEPGDITQAVMWLASDGSSFVTGAPLFVDAGFTAK